MEKVRVRWREGKQAFYAWTKDAALREEAALLSLTTAEPEIVQPPDLRNATTAITCTTLEPGPTCDQVSFEEEYPSVTTPAEVTLQSLIKHNPDSHGDTHVLPTVRHPNRFDLSSLSLNQVDAIDIAPDPSSSACSILEQVSDWPSSFPHQPDTIDTIIAIFNRWKAESSIHSHGCSSQPKAVPPSSSQSSQSTTPEQSRKRTSDQRNPDKQSRAKRPKVSNDSDPQVRKEDKRLLACPFWKKDPIGHRDCFRGVRRIRDVKQHLRRSHQQPVFCARCGTIFGDEQAALTEHVRAAERCQMREFPEPGGINAEHQKALRRYSDRSADERQQWYVIWDYLFPGGLNGKPPPPRPNSPYVDQDLSEDMSSFREFSHREGWRTLANDPGLSDIAFHIDEELLQRCLDRIYDTWLANRSTPSQQPWGESPFTLPDSSSPDDRVPINNPAGIDYQPGDNSMMPLGDFAANLDFANNFSGSQIDDLFDSFMAIPNMDDDVAQTLPIIPLLTSDHGFEQAI
jgi:hypothetical protein